MPFLINLPTNSIHDTLSRRVKVRRHSTQARVELCGWLNNFIVHLLRIALKRLRKEQFSPMTSQEISKFVNQPTPREIPENILSMEGMLDHRTGLIGVFLMSLMILLLSSVLPTGRLPTGGLPRHIERGLILFLICTLGWLGLRRMKGPLREGRFVTGCVSEIRRARMLWILPLPDFDVIVTFSDQYGAMRTGRKKILQHAYPTCRQWFDENRLVGLLYLPGKKEVFITDLWLTE